jgi:serine/threonine protein kinase
LVKSLKAVRNGRRIRSVDAKPEAGVVAEIRLNRDVALKVLPEVFAADPDRMARFEREARVLGALNHPNIAAIYGLAGILG